MYCMPVLIMVYDYHDTCIGMHADQARCAASMAYMKNRWRRRGIYLLETIRPLRYWG